MKRPVAYTYVVASIRPRTKDRWALSILLPDGSVETMATYGRRSKAISAARLLASSAGHVEVRS